MGQVIAQKDSSDRYSGLPLLPAENTAKFAVTPKFSCSATTHDQWQNQNGAPEPRGSNLFDTGQEVHHTAAPALLRYLPAVSGRKGAMQATDQTANVKAGSYPQNARAGDLGTWSGRAASKDAHATEEDVDCAAGMRDRQAPLAHYPSP
jgi:hypothetical protein